jgi:hypothetical protein
VEVRLTARTVEIFVKGERIAVHLRSSGNGKHTTAADALRGQDSRLTEVERKLRRADSRE